MPSQVTFEVDTHELEQLNRFFTQKDWLRIRKNALNKAATLLKKSVRNAFKVMLPKAMHKNDKYNDRLIDAIRKTRTVVNNEVISTKVHTLGTRKSGSRTYQARFFEIGTKDRTRPAIVDKLGRSYPSRSIGHITPHPFFEEGMSKEREAEHTITSLLEAEINKLNQKKFK